jgi:hypothetical protein
MKHLLVSHCTHHNRQECQPAHWHASSLLCAASSRPDQTRALATVTSSCSASHITQHCTCCTAGTMHACHTSPSNIPTSEHPKH